MSKDNNANDKKSVVEDFLADVDGENLVSPRKVYVFDDDTRFLVNKKIVPAYYLKDERLTSLHQEFSITGQQELDFFTNRLRDETEDELRSAIGAVWINFPKLMANGITRGNKNVAHAYVAFPDTTHKDVKSTEQWYINDRNIPERKERITIKPSLAPGGPGIPKETMQREVEALAMLATRIFFNEHRFVYDKDTYYKTTGKRHTDFTTAYFKPFSFKELEGKSYMNKPLYYKCRSDYNFYVKAYENLDWERGERKDDTAILPDLNVFLMEEISPDKVNNQHTNYHKFVTLANQLPDMFKDVLNEKGEKVGEKSKGQYFEKWSHIYNTMIAVNGGLNRQIFTNMRKRHSNVLVSYELNKRLLDYQYKRFMFPMFFELDFSTDTNTFLADLLVDAKLDGSILKTIVEGTKGEFAEGNMKNKLRFKSNNPPDQGDAIFTVEKNAIAMETKQGRQMSDEERTLFRQSSFKLYDDSNWNWINQYSKNGAKIFANSKDESFSVLAPLDSEYYNMLHESEDDKGESKFIKNLLMTIFKARFMGLVKEKTRSFKQILAGKTANSETIAYRIEKWRCNEVGTPVEVIQNYYYSNTRNLDILKHVDTQLRYGEKYHYKVYSWRVIYGTEYEYKIPQKYISALNLMVGGDVMAEGLGGVGAGTAIGQSFLKLMQKEISHLDIDIISRPNVKVVEVPYFSCSTRLMDSPPVPPNVNIVPYKNVNNKIKINLSSNTGEVKQEPIVIQTENGDEESLKNIYEAQELAQGSVIEFQSDDPPQTFQVFRINTEPTSYEDFKDAMREYDVTGFSSFSLDDNLVPNTKYYYTFRVKDIHGHVSNPSEIYKVEIIDNSGAVYLLIDIFEIQPRVLRSRKSMKRYLSIIPQPEQRFINEEKTQIEYDNTNIGKTAVGLEPVLGQAEETIFNRGPEKYFKIRLISKKTGRKLDINVAFETKHMNIEVKKKEDIKDSDSGTTAY
tara:strand:+ start:398 stop:3286 length:2889 start_codon:yes stop_codon:yes gene_type:complete